MASTSHQSPSTSHDEEPDGRAVSLGHEHLGVSDVELPAAVGLERVAQQGPGRLLDPAEVGLARRPHVHRACLPPESQPIG